MTVPSPAQLRERRLRLKRRWESKLGVMNHPSQAEVAKRIPIHVVNLCKWERGHVTPREVYLVRWKAVLYELELECKDQLRKWVRSRATAKRVTALK